MMHPDLLQARVIALENRVLKLEGNTMMKGLNEKIRRLEVLVDMLNIIESNDLSNEHYMIVEDAVNQIKGE